MSIGEARLHKIDMLVADSGHSFNPQTGRFEAVDGSEADNNLDHEWSSFLATLPGVSEDELRAYVSWKKQQADDEYHQELAEEIIKEREQSGDQ